MIRVLLALAFLLAGCASPVVVPLRTVPSQTCDQRMVDHNRRACAERGFDFLEPVAGGNLCGACVRAVPMPSNR